MPIDIDEERLLAAMERAPGDAGPRRAYADWLEARGDVRSEYFHAEDRLRSTPLGDASRQALGRAWRELRASLDPMWLGRVDCSPPVPAWFPVEGRRPPHAGLTDWEHWASQSHYEWVLLAALAPIEQVVRTVVQLRTGALPDVLVASGRWQRSLPVQPAKMYEAGGPGIPFVQLRGHAWTVAMYGTFQFSLPMSRAAQSDARELSDRLGTLALEYSAEHVSSATGYQLFECGDLIEFAEHAPGETIFASKRRPLPWPQAPADFPDELFQALGLYLPGFYADRQAVRIGIPHPICIARADVLTYSWRHEEVRPAEAIRRDGFAEIHHLTEDGHELLEGTAWDENDRDLPF